jgi:hypothetical protein
MIPFSTRASHRVRIARSIRIVARTERKNRRGHDTGAHVRRARLQHVQSTPPWPVVAELEKQYEVVQIAAQDSIREGGRAGDRDAVALEEMNHVQEDLMARGTPTLLDRRPL